MNTPRPLPFLQNGHNSKSKQSRRKYAVYKHTFSMEKQKEKFGRRCKEKMMIAKIRKDVRALSPIFAVLILIAIAVIAGIVVYMFTSGTIATMTGQGTAGQEKVAVEAVVPANGGGSAVVWAKSTGGTTVVVDGAIIKDSGGITQAVVVPTGTLSLDASGTLTDLTVTSAELMSGSVYTITLTSENGGSFVSAAFEVP
jgi:flagellin-like protein